MTFNLTGQRPFLMFPPSCYPRLLPGLVLCLSLISCTPEAPTPTSPDRSATQNTSAAQNVPSSSPTPIQASPNADAPTPAAAPQPSPTTVWPPADRKRAAARFLNQATFGATASAIDALTDSEVDLQQWIDAQLQLPPTLHAAIPHRVGRSGRFDVWWSVSTQAADQLRQRMAFALSQLFVISDEPDVLTNYEPAVTDYYDLLVSSAFGNFRELMHKVTLNLPMGIYLSMKDSQKADPATGTRPDENYAREIMQLFTIGLVELNLDGSPKLNNGQPIPTYTQHDVEELARVLTGWSSANAYSYIDFDHPMKAYPEYHDTGAKEFLGHTVPAGLSPEEDLERALDIIFNHPNVAPFIARHLIQRFVTSNPAPDYIRRVATVFNDNGAGVRGDLGAVIKAVLTDPEATHERPDDPHFGKLREPLLKITHLFRIANGQIDTSNYWRVRNDLLQAPLRSPTVFNFFYPDFRPAGQIRAAGLVAPEFQITTTSSMTSTTNKLFAMALGEFDNDATLDVADLVPLAQNHNALVDYLDLVLTAKQLSTATRETLTNYLDTHTQLSAEEKIRDLLYLVLTSAEYAVQR